MVDVPEFKKFSFPIIKKLVVPNTDPIRQTIDYISQPRRSMLVDWPDPPCPICKKMTDDGAESGCPHCIVRDVMES